MSAHFRYEARGPSGRVERGTVEAASRAEALTRLKGRALTPLSLNPARGRTGATTLNDREARDLSRTLAQLLRSGLSLAQALRFASEQLEGGAANAALQMRERAERGDLPSQALASFAGARARLLAGVLRAGETSGRLAEALELAAAAFARAADLRARLVTALIYPLFVISATFAVLGVFIFFVVPTMAGAFEGREQDLPDSTRTLLAFSRGLQTYWPFLLLGLAASGAFVWLNTRVRRAIGAATDRALYSPIGAGVAPRLDFAAFARLAALSLDAGVSVAAAFDTAAAGVSSAHLRARLEAAVAAVRRGDRPSAALDQFARPPVALIRLMQVGEESGRLPAALTHAGELLSAEAEQRLQRLGAVGGPIVTLILGGLVASVVISLFLGLLSMSDLATM